MARALIGPQGGRVGPHGGLVGSEASVTQTVQPSTLGTVRALSAPHVSIGIVHVQPMACPLAHVLNIPILRVGIRNIAPFHFASSAIVDAPFIQAGTIGITHAALNTARQIYACIVQPRQVTLQLSSLTHKAQEHAPFVVHGGTLVVPSQAMGNARINEPHIQPESVFCFADPVMSLHALVVPALSLQATIAIPVHLGTHTLAAPTIQTRNGIAGEGLPSPHTVHRPLVQPQPHMVVAPVLSPSHVLIAPHCSQGALVLFTPPLVATHRLDVPQIQPGVSTIRLSFVVTNHVLGVPGIQPIAVQVAMQHLMARTALYAPSAAPHSVILEVSQHVSLAYVVAPLVQPQGLRSDVTIITSSTALVAPYIDATLMLVWSTLPAQHTVAMPQLALHCRVPLLASPTNMQVPFVDTGQTRIRMTSLSARHQIASLWLQPQPIQVAPAQLILQARMFGIYLHASYGYLRGQVHDPPGGTLRSPGMSTVLRSPHSGHIG